MFGECSRKLDFMATYTLTEKVKNFAIVSRITVLALQIFANVLIPDHESDAFVSPPDPSLPYLFGDKIVEFLFGGLVRWDAQYFLHVAQYGYTHENTLAFFPLFPLLVRGLGALLHIPLQIICNFKSCLLLASVLLNFILFVKTSIIFFRLSKEVLRNECLAYRAALLFCINPASIFFSAPYSECLFAFLTFSAILTNESRSSTLASIPFGLASATRSNGLVNVGFLLYRKLQDCTSYYYKIRHATTESGQLSLVIVVILTFNYTLLPLTIGCALLGMPFALFQFWCYWTYCGEEGVYPAPPAHLELYVRSNFLHSPDLGEAEWCYNFPPIAYAHVQDKYWEVGLLRYYEMKQVPNFMLALPVVMTVICHAALYMVDNPQVCWSLGIPQSTVEGLKEKGASSGALWKKDGINSWKVFIYTAHSLALCIFCVLCIHVQVTTRLLCSSSPVVYWFAAHLISEVPGKVSSSPKHSSSPCTSSREALEPRAESQANLNKMFVVIILSEFPRTFWGQVIISYFVLYFFIGIVLFSNSLPWT